MSVNRSVLLVDDDEQFLTALAERLELRDLLVDTATSGELALVKAKQRAFDAILLDMAMPGMDGIGTLKGLLDVNPDLQVILLTGQATLGQAVEAMKLGALDLLEKPADMQTLVAMIDQAARTKSRLTTERLDKKLKDIMRKRSW